MPHQSSKSAGFGGMKKGFLFSSSSKTSSASEASNSVKVVSVGCDQKTKDEDIPLITPKKDFTDSQHKFDEVQQAMQVNDAFAMNKGDLFFFCIKLGWAVLEAKGDIVCGLLGP